MTDSQEVEEAEEDEHIVVEAIELEARVVGDHASVHQYGQNHLMHHKEVGRQGESALTPPLSLIAPAEPCCVDYIV
jgi:hypothetical protein